MGSGGEHAHHRGVIHCDLKPGNILIECGGEDEQPRPRIVDFGVSRIVSRGDLTKTLARDVRELAGTLAYMSPERLSGEAADPTIATDIFSLGVIGYEMLADCLPVTVEATSVLLAIQAHLRGVPTRLGRQSPQCAGDLETIIHKAFDRDPKRRFGSAGELTAELRRWLNHQPIQSRPASAWYRFTRLIRRNRAMSAVTGLLVLSLVTGSVVSAWLSRHASRERFHATRRSTSRPVVSCDR